MPSDFKSDISKAADSLAQSITHTESRFLGTLAHNWYWVALGAAVLGFVAGKAI